MSYFSPMQETTFSKGTVNKIRELAEAPELQTLIAAAKKSDKRFLSLALGDPTVFKNLKAPQILIDALAESSKDIANHGYPMSTGNPELREILAKQYSFQNNVLGANDVCLASGASGALEILFKALVSPTSASPNGKKLLLPDPGFTLYDTICGSYSMPFEKYDLVERKSWQVDLVGLRRKLMENPNGYAAILVNNPSNPCGMVYSADHLRSLLQIAQEFGLVVVADEIYGEIAFEPHRFIPMAGLVSADTSVPIVSVGGIAKELLVPGLRVGWMLFYNSNSEQIRKFMAPAQHGAQKLCQVTMGANSITQAALVKVFKNHYEEIRTFKRELSKTLSDQAIFFAKRLNEIRNGLGEKVFEVTQSQGSMYCMIKVVSPMFADDKSCLRRFDVDISLDPTVWLVKRLIQEEHIFILPGAPFGKNSEHHLRATITPPKEILEEACLRLEHFAVKFL